MDRTTETYSHCQAYVEFVAEDKERKNEHLRNFGNPHSQEFIDACKKDDAKEQELYDRCVDDFRALNGMTQHCDLSYFADIDLDSKNPADARKMVQLITECASESEFSPEDLSKYGEILTQYRYQENKAAQNNRERRMDHQMVTDYDRKVNQDSLTAKQQVGIFRRTILPEDGMYAGAADRLKKELGDAYFRSVKYNPDKPWILSGTAEKTVRMRVMQASQPENTLLTEQANAVHTRYDRSVHATYQTIQERQKQAAEKPVSRQSRTSTGAGARCVAMAEEIENRNNGLEQSAFAYA